MICFQILLDPIAVRCPGNHPGHRPVHLRRELRSPGNGPVKSNERIKP